jgi:carbonic anhydrase/acetyltransferase-like protein (isoleucine patch superfamily)
MGFFAGAGGEVAVSEDIAADHNVSPMPIYALGDRTPDIHGDAFVHPDAVVVGSVSIGADASIWPGAVLRGDYGDVSVGSRTSIQDGTVVHATAELATVIGADCVVGHVAHLEGCVIEDHALVGSGSIVLHQAVVRSHALVGANAVVSNGVEVPSHAMALGVPAKMRDGVVPENFTDHAVAIYVENARRYKRDLKRIG